MLRFLSFAGVAAVGSAAVVLGACGGGGNDSPRPDAQVDGPPVDAGPMPDADPARPMRLLDTGLCVDAACNQIAAGVRLYAPRWQLWTDGAAKRRWISLPPNAKIDNSDPDHWEFPVGTKLWKEFSLGGVRVETRYIVRLDDALPHYDDWFMVSYVWNSAQTDAVIAPRGMENANGTTHDVPSANDCGTCHSRVMNSDLGINSLVLGFSALALDFPGAPGELDLEDTNALGWFTDALPGTASPRYPLPTGRNADETANAPLALGYLHMNCGHCHNPISPVFVGSPLELRLEVGKLATWPATPTYLKTVDKLATQAVDGSTLIVTSGDALDSVLIKRMISTDSAIHMPELGSVVVDESAQAYLRAWINSLPMQ
jgi:hypothetical protein